MPKPKNKPTPPNHKKEEEEEKLPEEEFEEEGEEGGLGEEEEEYDPNEKFEPEKKKKEKEPLDLSKLTKKQREVYTQNNKRLLFLKALARDPYQDIGKLAIQKCKLNDKGQGEQCVTVMMGMITETANDSDYPTRLLKYFNGLVPDGYPNKVELDEGDVNELTVLFKVYEEKLTNSAKVTDPDKIWGETTPLNAETIKESTAQKKVLNDNFNPNQPNLPFDNGELFSNNNNQNQPERNSMDAYVNKYANPDVGLMEMALRSVPNPRPNSINNFIVAFTDLYTDWMNNPMKMLEQLKFYFGPTHGEHAYRLWKDYREKYQKQQGYSPVGMGVGTSGGEYQPYGFNSYGMQPMQVSPEIEAERMADRRMDKMMKMLQLKMMDNAMQNQTPMAGMMGQSFEEIYDQNGKVVKRIMLPNGHNGGSGSGNNPMESVVFQGMVNMMQEIVKSKNSEMIEIMKNQSQPTSLLTDFATKMLNNQINNQNPISQIKEMLDITNLVKSQAPQSNEAKTLEQTRLEIDSKLALQELDLKKMEMQHNWRMDEKQTMEQDSNVDKWLNTLQSMGTDIIKPVAIKFLEGFGKGQMPGSPLGAFMGGAAGGQQGAQQQNPYNGMTEQEYALRQQQYYEQQRQQNERPLQPMAPNPPHRQFNQPPPPPPQQPNPQQQYQQQPPQQQGRPISAVTERELQEELSRYSPEQIQAIEDKMMIEDMNREKIKSAILAFKNGRRFNKPQPQQQRDEQVEEAQNVLFKNPADALSEEDFGDLNDGYEPEEGDEGDDYEVPIARGDTKIAPEQKPTKKFSDYEVRSTTEIAKTKKLSPQQKAMLSSGQMTPAELAQIEDGEEEEDEYSSSGVPLPAGIYNESNEKLKEENLKQNKQTPKKSKKKTPVIEKTDEVEEQKEIAEAEQLLADVEEIPSDDT